MDTYSVITLYKEKGYNEPYLMYFKWHVINNKISKIYLDDPYILVDREYNYIFYGVFRIPYDPNDSVTDRNRKAWDEKLWEVYER